MKNKYIPTNVYKTVFDIPYNELYENRKRIILFDLDNTLASYEEIYPNKKIIELRKKLKEIGFLVYILSNNKEKRIKNFDEKLQSDGYTYRLLKPFTRRMKKFLTNKILSNNIKLENVIFIGDQLLTDTVCCNKIGLDIILVDTISRKSQSFLITLNRLREKNVIKKIEKVNPTISLKIKKLKEEGNNNE